MAKKKSKQSSQPISPKKFLAEKANTTPIYKCYITSNWEEVGEAQIIIARKRGNGKLCVASFLVDTWCMGVKDAFGDVNMSVGTFEEILDNSFDLVEIDYPTVHNIIYGAVEFAGEADIEPHDAYWTWKGVLDEDSDRIPFIDIEFGKNGKYFLMARPGSRESLMASKLSKRLGDRFDCILSYDDIESGYDPDEFPDEEYSYVRPPYPASLSIKNQFMASELLNPDNFSALPQPVIDRILALPPYEAASDLKDIIMFEIGRTYPDIDSGLIEETEESSIIHSLLLLTEIKSIVGLDAVLEIMRQNEAFYDAHLGDIACDFIAPALAETGKNNLQAIEKYLYEPGYFTFFRTIAPEALSLIALKYPEKRAEVIEIFRRLLKSLPERLPLRNACDSTFASLLISSLQDLKTPELLSEIEALCQTGYIDESLTGEFADIKNNILSADSSDYTRYTRTIKEQYDYLKS